MRAVKVTRFPFRIRMVRGDNNASDKLTLKHLYCVTRTRSLPTPVRLASIRCLEWLCTRHFIVIAMSYVRPTWLCASIRADVIFAVRTEIPCHR